MTDFHHQWTTESAMEILRHPTVDSQIWADAVEWLMLFGPPEIRELLQQAGSQTIQENFPELRVRRFAQDGSLCYDLGEIAQILSITEKEAREQLQEMEAKHGIRYGFSEDDTSEIQ